MQTAAGKTILNCYLGIVLGIMSRPADPESRDRVESMTVDGRYTIPNADCGMGHRHMHARKRRGCESAEFMKFDQMSFSIIFRKPKCKCNGNG
jgi:hypothetical protein